MKINKFIAVILTTYFTAQAVFPQAAVSAYINEAKSRAKLTQSAKEQLSEEKSSGLLNNAQLAMSSADYLVTPGDIYSLAYAAGTNAIQYTISVDTTYKVRVANLGILDVKGKTFLQFKQQVELLVTKNYPMSGVQFVLVTPANFKVMIKGEVKSTTEKGAWALTRLSNILDEDTLTNYSSTRDVLITSADGQKNKYDLFKSVRLGDQSQDPYLRPGDTIEINRCTKKVQVTGAVERPGIYELFDGENLQALITLYGNGLAPLADTSRIELYRKLDNSKKTADAGKKIYLKTADVENDYPLINYDTVFIASYEELMPIIFIEGAVEGEKTEAAASTNSVANTSKLTLTFNNGEDYAFFLRKNKQIFMPESDLKNAYVIRDGESIPMNIEPMLYDATYYSNVQIDPNDTLIIPFKQYFVTVSGAVANPGRYPYIPDRTYDYYVGLAGGFLKEKNTGNSVTITNIAGKKLSKADFITPETNIEAKSNSFLYRFNLIAPVVTTILSIVTTSILVYNQVNN